MSLILITIAIFKGEMWEIEIQVTVLYTIESQSEIKLSIDQKRVGGFLIVIEITDHLD